MEGIKANGTKKKLMVQRVVKSGEMSFLILFARTLDFLSIFLFLILLSEKVKVGQIVVIQSLKSCLTLFDAIDCSTPGFTVLHYLQVCSNSCPLCPWCHPIISYSVAPFCLQSFPGSGSFIMSQFFASGPKYWSFSISPFSEYSGLISFRIDWFDLLAVQGTLKSLL